MFNSIKNRNLININYSFFKKILLALFIFSTIFNIPISKSKSKETITPDYFTKDNSEEYILGEGDQLKIIISQALPELSNIYQIDSSGKIYFPYLNRIYISGLTLNELSNLLNKELLDYIKNPNVEVSINGYRPVRIFLDGEIETPGLYTLRGNYLNQVKALGKVNNTQDNLNQVEALDNVNNTQDNLDFVQQELSGPTKNYGLIKNGANSYNLNYYPTIFDAIRRAGGITNYSDLSNIVLIRKNSLTNGGGRKKTKVNFLDFFEEGNFNQNLRIYDGDFIKIGRSEKSSTYQLSKAIKSNLNPKFIQVFISGRVESPGVYQLTKNSTLQDALSISGGTKALRGKIFLTRFNQDGTIEKRNIRRINSKKRGNYNNPFLKPGDLITVGKNPINIFNEVIGEVASPILNSYSLYEIFND